MRSVGPEVEEVFSVGHEVVREEKVVRNTPTRKSSESSLRSRSLLGRDVLCRWSVGGVPKSPVVRGETLVSESVNLSGYGSSVRGTLDHKSEGETRWTDGSHPDRVSLVSTIGSQLS